ncbi:MAG: hypothetical protein ACI921_001988, partial [Polaribacter sp.]
MKLKIGILRCPWKWNYISNISHTGCKLNES